MSGRCDAAHYPQASLLSSLRLNQAQLVITDTPTNIVAAHFLHSLHQLEGKSGVARGKRKAPLIFPETDRLASSLWSHARRCFSSFSLIIFVTLPETN